MAIEAVTIDVKHPTITTDLMDYTGFMKTDNLTNSFGTFTPTDKIILNTLSSKSKYAADYLNKSTRKTHILKCK